MKKLVISITCGAFAMIAGVVLFVLLLAAGESETDSNNTAGNYDIVQVALNERGTVGGDKYRTWYIGRADGAAWCASFVSWCADQCDYIVAGIIPKFQGCDWGIQWFDTQGQFIYTPRYGGSSYTPKSGDLIFFSRYYTVNDSTHIGIVQYSEGNTVTTIEGNTSNSVAERNYDLDDPRILGYATPNYPSGDFSGDTNAAIAWNYFISKGCNAYAAAGILGNLQREAPGIVPTMAQSGGPGRGIGQWEIYSDRWNGLVTFAEQRGSDWTALEIQLEYIWYELNGGDPTTVRILNNNYGGITRFKNAQSIEWATEAFEKSFERAGIPNMSLRIQYAYTFYRQFA